MYMFVQSWLLAVWSSVSSVDLSLQVQVQPPDRREGRIYIRVELYRPTHGESEPESETTLIGKAFLSRLTPLLLLVRHPSKRPPQHELTVGYTLVRLPRPPPPLRLLSHCRPPKGENASKAKADAKSSSSKADGNPQGQQSTPAPTSGGNTGNGKDKKSKVGAANSFMCVAVALVLVVVFRSVGGCFFGDPPTPVSASTGA